jgi:hypothetical protein
MNDTTLTLENLAYAGTGGISRNNAGLGLLPGFLDMRTGRIYRSRYADGSPAPVHLLEGLREIRQYLVAGFIREDRFYTREQAARLAAQLGN